MNHKKTLLAVAFLAILFVVVSVIGSIIPNGRVAADTTTKDLTGYAWSSNIGWISFRNAVGATPSYGVTWNANDTLTGYAWANPFDAVGNTNNIGWLMFNPNGPYPDGCSGGVSSCGVKVVGSKLTGWARFCAAAPNPATCDGGTGSNTDANNWDGWVKMSKNSGDAGADYGVDVVSDGSGGYKFQNYAWGGDVAGWISFNPKADCASGNVCTTPPGGGLTLLSCPANQTVYLAGNPSVTAHLSISVSGGTPSYTYTWTNQPSGTQIAKNTKSATTDSADVPYDAIGTYKVRVSVTDSGSPADTKTCPDASIEVKAGNPPAGGGTGSLLIDANDRNMYIRNQASGQSAISEVSTSHPGAMITNNSDPATGGAVSGITFEVKSQKNNNPPAGATCAFDSNGTSNNNFYPCTGNPAGNDWSLALGETKYLRIKIALPLKSISDNNPYKVTISGITNVLAGDPPVSTPTTVYAKDSSGNLGALFNYLVSTFTPQ